MKKLISILLLICFLPDIAHAATEYATFESFYKTSPYIGWTFATVIALVAGAVILFTGGTASPVVAAIGTWLGGMMGLSGIAATNAGLALLGGGSIASGGFGIVGGTALLTAAFSYGTDVVLDYTIGKAVSEYQYSSLAAQSKEMPTLPLPVNSSGSDEYEKAIEMLEDIDKESLIYSSSNQNLIIRAIKVIETDKEKPDRDERIKNESLLSLLYFVSNDYLAAKRYADQAIKHARYSGNRRTLPSFIYATSTLYEEKFDFTKITNKYFSYSVLEEPDNPLIPVLFSLYLDRMQLRFNDGYLNLEDLTQIFSIMRSPLLEDLRVQNYVILLSRYFIHIKLEQQKILSLATSSNDVIKESPKTLEAVEISLSKYKQLVIDAGNVMTNIISLKLEDESRDKVAEFHELLFGYALDILMLASHVDELKTYQNVLAQDIPATSGDMEINSDKKGIYIIIILIVIIGLLVAIGALNKVSSRRKL